MGNFCYAHRRPEDKNKWPRSAGAVRDHHKVVDMSHGEEDKWVWNETEYSGSYSYAKPPEFEEVAGTIEEGKETCRNHPEEYEGLVYQSDMTGWPEDQQKYKLLRRNG